MPTSPPTASLFRGDELMYTIASIAVFQHITPVCMGNKWPTSRFSRWDLKTKPAC